MLDVRGMFFDPRVDPPKIGPHCAKFVQLWRTCVKHMHRGDITIAMLSVPRYLRLVKRQVIRTRPASLPGTEFFLFDCVFCIDPFEEATLVQLTHNGV